MLAASSDNGLSEHPWNVGLFLREYTAQRTTRQSSAYSSSSEPEISPRIVYVSLCLNEDFRSIQVSNPEPWQLLACRNVSGSTVRRLSCVWPDAQALHCLFMRCGFLFPQNNKKTFKDLSVCRSIHSGLLLYFQISVQRKVKYPHILYMPLCG